MRNEKRQEDKGKGGDMSDKQGEKKK